MCRYFYIFCVWFLLTAEWHLQAGDDGGKEQESNVSFVSSGLLSVNDNDGVLVPSFLVPDVLSRLKSYKDFSFVAPTYMNGYSTELAQIITKNRVSDYRVNRENWFRFGSEDAIAFAKKAFESGEALDGSALHKFGYEKVKIVGTYNILRQVEYGVDGNRIQTYAAKEIVDALEKEVRMKKGKVHLVLFGWISPIGVYDSESIKLPRILLIERYAPTKIYVDRVSPD